MTKSVMIRLSVINSLLTYSLSNHPKEGILLLRGKLKKDTIEVNDIVIPPLSIHGYSFSSFPLHMLPLDSSVVGTAHSHPSGVLEPSLDDLLHYYGVIMVIVGYPYNSEKEIKVFDREGNSLPFLVKV